MRLPLQSLPPHEEVLIQGEVHQLLIRDHAVHECRTTVTLEGLSPVVVEYPANATIMLVMLASGIPIDVAADVTLALANEVFATDAPAVLAHGQLLTVVPREMPGDQANQLLSCQCLAIDTFRVEHTVRCRCDDTVRDAIWSIGLPTPLLQRVRAQLICRGALTPLLQPGGTGDAADALMTPRPQTGALSSGTEPVGPLSLFDPWKAAAQVRKPHAKWEEARVDRLEARLSGVETKQETLATQVSGRFDEVALQLSQILGALSAPKSPRDWPSAGATPPPKQARRGE